EAVGPAFKQVALLPDREHLAPHLGRGLQERHPPGGRPPRLPLDRLQGGRETGDAPAHHGQIHLLCHHTVSPLDPKGSGRTGPGTGSASGPGPALWPSYSPRLASTRSASASMNLGCRLGHGTRMNSSPSLAACSLWSTSLS